LSAYSNSPASRWWNSALRQALTEENPYLEVNIPQQDLEVEDNMSRRQIQHMYEGALDDADVVVVALDGVENEAWTGYECGYARATGKFLLGIAASPRFTGRSRIEDMCDDVVEFSTLDDWQTTLATIAKEVNSRVLTEHALENAS
jgi:nucleoside 2-deoxyribosyltransferase